MMFEVTGLHRPVELDTAANTTSEIAVVGQEMRWREEMRRRIEESSTYISEAKNFFLRPVVSGGQRPRMTSTTNLLPK